MSYYDDCLIRFNGLPEDIKEKVGNIEVVSLIKKLGDQYKIDLSFLIILVMINEVKIKDIPTYLEKKYQIDYEDAVKIREELLNNIFSLILDERKRILPKVEDKIKEIFQNQIVDALRGDEVYKEVLNEEILNQFALDEGLTPENLLKIFYSNQEKLTGREFILDGRQTEPTVANWIRDFIKSEGSDIFNELALSKYLINSANAKLLNEEEKKLLRKLLALYRNLKFFPESLADLPPEEWEIIPMEKTKEVLTKARTVSAPTQAEAKREPAVILFPEPEKEDPLKATPAGANLDKEEELPNISRLINQARKEAEEKLAETNSTLPPIKTMTLEEVASQAERAVSELKIILNPEEKNRLKNILVSFLKGIRNQIETKDALLKSKEEGGLNFTQRQVEQIFNLIKKEKPLKEESRAKEKILDVSFDKQTKDVLRAPSEDDKKEEALLQLQPPPPVILETFREKLKEKITSQPTLSQLSQPSVAPAETRGEPSQPFRPAPPPLPSQMLPVRQIRRADAPEIKEAKPRLQDIKRPSFFGQKPRVELVGPIEEIRNLSLSDLREMSDNPAKALEKIKEKIFLLEKKSFLKKIQAIKAWHENEIYQLYLEIGRQVIQERTNLEKTLERRQSQGLPVLTKEEFSAIMDFNKSLRF